MADNAELTDVRPGPYANPLYRWYALAVMILVYSCHAMDRGLPGVLMEPIREEFKLSDSQLGLISSSSYGIAFALAVIPMGMLSDRLNRRRFLAAILVGWSLCTALGGFARNVYHLALVRVGVGVFESGAAPVAMPLVSDMFPARSRTFALGVFYMSANLGTFLAGSVGGYVAAEYGWRPAFLLVGAPGVLIAVLFLLTVREPVRGGDDAPADADDGPAPPLKAVLAFLARTPGLICLIFGSALVALISISMGTWMGSFFIRVHGLDLKQVGLILGVGGGLCGVLSPPISGWLADRLSARDPRWTLRIVWLSLLGAFAAGMTMLFAPLVTVAIAAYVAADFLRSAYAPLTYSVIITQTPVRMRGTVMSIVQMLSVLIGFGLGPVVTGFLSDLHGGGTAIRLALRDAQLLFLVIIVLYIAATALIYGRARRVEAAT